VIFSTFLFCFQKSLITERSCQPFDSLWEIIKSFIRNRMNSGNSTQTEGVQEELFMTYYVN
ncbi:MAG: hypothetical protein VXW15_03690, partial [Bdellovibrionota bacterium]|nr:hypothetical protein [Bdellovibrionota bacterium]